MAATQRTQAMLGHDFRPGTAEPAEYLSATWRVVPVVFYGCLAITATILALSAYLTGLTEGKIRAVAAETTDVDLRIVRKEAERKRHLSVYDRARQISDWLGRSPLYVPVATDVLGAISESTTLSRLSVAADPKGAAQIVLTVVVNGPLAPASRQSQAISARLQQIGYALLRTEQQASRDATVFTYTMIAPRRRGAGPPVAAEPDGGAAR